ncbi:unnamed protein product [Phaedon cochleariae]|uniref:Fibrinogen C-terminal domain-containing protein n=1 Tax=Phaedon cochleariae TaxID=80249 RepID=A0A9P0DHN3_PHACE|nr:unnamed protein product [Phaedon cochleariae]
MQYQFMFSKMSPYYVILYFYIFRNSFCEVIPTYVNDILKENNVTTNDGNKFIKGGNNSINFTLTKLFNIRLEGKYENLHPAVQDVVHSQMMAESEGLNRGQSQESYVDGQILNKIKKEFETVKDLLQNHNNCELTLEKYLEGLINSKPTTMSGRNDEDDYHPCEYSAVCRSLVGIDKLPICQSLERNRSFNFQKNTTKRDLPRNCKEIQENGHTVSGLYEIQPKTSKKSFMVLCDMETKGGGWTHIQKRVDGSVDFYRGWREYKHGFGKLEGEFWIGLENIYALTGFEVNELLIEIVDRDQVTAYAHYKAFGIGPEKEGYPLKVLRDFFGDAGDSLTDHLGSKFTTKDLDQDTNPSNCAVLFDGAWWYKSCHISNLNGKYLNVDLPAQYKFHGLHWKTFRSHEYCHARARMMVRPAQS